MQKNYQQLIDGSDKQVLYRMLIKIGREKSRAYKRIEEIIEQEDAINRRLGEIYESTRTDVSEP